jgi:ATP-dependent DNA helicase RecG
LASGSIDIAVGTHALFQEGVDFRDLGLAVVDEQHRFGVHQRLALGAKGEAVDILVMTATPIPRSLALTYFGDMDVSVLDEKPAGRKPIATRLVSTERLDDVAAGLGRALAAGDRVYWICPLVAESEFTDLAAAEDRFNALRSAFGGVVGLVHGKMAGRDKDAAMERFASGETKILVSTTVVEVGVDVPEATMMVVEGADRFGLAQLHQLRGRVGRGTAESFCVLVSDSTDETAQARLKAVAEIRDGFELAEKDFELRREGDVLGLAQSGLPRLRVASLQDREHVALARRARDHAETLLDEAGRLGPDASPLLRELERGWLERVWVGEPESGA